MPYCPKCRNKLSDGIRICPSCGATMVTSIAARRARAKKRARQRMITMLCIVLALIAIIAAVIWFTRDKEPVNPDPGTKPSQPTGTQQTEPTQTEPMQTESTQTDPTQTESTQTEPTQTDPPTDPPTQPPTDSPTEPPTAPPIDFTGDPSDRIGSLYTRGELTDMDTTYNPDGYGAGKTSAGKRPGGPVSDQNKYGQYGGNFIGADNSNIYLTFDCGYEYTATDENGNKYRVTERILDVLKEKNAKAVFFVTMYYVKEQPDLVQRMIDEGHAVGNHTNNHPVMPKQTIDKMVYEVMSLHDYVKEHFGYEMTLFRPPTGAFSVQSLSVLKSLGYKTMLWSFQYYDYDTEDQMAVDKALEKVTSSHHNGAIYLLHAISETNAAILADAIDFFRAEGYNVELFK